MARKKTVELFTERNPDRIVDGKGNQVPTAEARRLWDAGLVSNCNLSLRRLATHAGWDFAELARQYAEMDKLRGR